MTLNKDGKQLIFKIFGFLRIVLITPAENTGKYFFAIKLKLNALS
jgi:hypothetical protein